MAGVLRAALTSTEFIVGLRIGLVTALAGMVGGRFWRWKTGKPVAVTGILFSVAVLLALPAVRLVPREVPLGLGLLGLAGLLSGVVARSLPLRVALAVPGAWLIVAAIPTDYSSWTRWFLIGAIAVGGPLVAFSDKVLSSPALGPVFLAVTVAGVYVDVPDTEEMLVLLGVAAALTLLGSPLGGSPLGSAGSYMAVGTLIWASSWGGVGRTASMVGAVACLGVFLTIPLAVRPEDSGVRVRWPALVGVHLLVVAVCSRVAGIREHPLEALIIAILALALGLGLTAKVLRSRPALVAADQGNDDPTGDSSGD